LKPAHILLLADGSIRVLDFGIAKALAVQKPATTNCWASVDYASPERLESGRVNEQVDFWSLGVILFEMLAGVRPYRDYEHSRSQLETAIRRQEPRLRLPRNVDPGLAAIVDKLLAPQIERRYRSAKQIGQDLEAFLNGGPVVALAEAARAAQATMRVPPPAEIVPRSESIVPTEPLPPLREAVPGLTWPHRGEPIAATEAHPPGVPLAPPAAPAAAPKRHHKPWIAAVLSFVAPGFGQIYNREFLRGLFWLIITPGFWVGSAGLFGWPFHLISAYTAYQRAQSKRSTGGASPSGSRGMPVPAPTAPA
jgi:hypothetical protein